MCLALSMLLQPLFFSMIEHKGRELRFKKKKKGFEERLPSAHLFLRRELLIWQLAGTQGMEAGHSGERPNNQVWELEFL